MRARVTNRNGTMEARMDLFDAVALIVVATALLSYLNYKYFHLPKTIGLMLSSFVLSLAFMAADSLGANGTVASAAKALGAIDFSEALLGVILCFMLFAGALHIDLSKFWEQRWSILALSILGTMLSTFIVGIGAYGLLYLFGYTIPFVVCLLFGALISPTDPISVLALLKESHVNPNVEMKVAGESLLNDGVGVVLFLSILGIAAGTEEVTLSSVSTLLLQEVGGGTLLGVVAGYLTYHLLKRVDDYCIEILLSIALVVGGYALAGALHVSGPLAMVAAGLFIGNRGRSHAMSETTKRNLDLFWEVVDDILNATLFVLVGFEALLLAPKIGYLYVGIAFIPLVLVARFVSVSASSYAVHTLAEKFDTYTVFILTWGGLRGGISLALALALPHEMGRDLLVFVTYTVVAFSILVQGLTFENAVQTYARKRLPA